MYSPTSSPQLTSDLRGVKTYLSKLSPHLDLGPVDRRMACRPAPHLNTIVVAQLWIITTQVKTPVMTAGWKPRSQ
ncbi:hypothetical protein E2C01_065601 [Portunus trituberculatus]|uniref:Uncharacterized protein n=1 Tax=Portunus trituberculatus TaxID=210409 RepID=A0A5B7HNU2_PORTR|nr:hypothetical protein [Portunus trituberculatus]